LGSSLSCKSELLTQINIKKIIIIIILNLTQVKRGYIIIIDIILNLTQVKRGYIIIIDIVLKFKPELSPLC
jgi:hypothetical protein